MTRCPKFRTRGIVPVLGGDRNPVEVATFAGVHSPIDGPSEVTVEFP
jgi:hypothetical protein